MSLLSILPWLLLAALLPALVRALRGHPFSLFWALLSLIAAPTVVGWFALLGAALFEPKPQT